MFVIESCKKIEYNALFMMIFIPFSNFGDQPLVDSSKIFLSVLKVAETQKCDGIGTNFQHRLFSTYRHGMHLKKIIQYTNIFFKKWTKNLAPQMNLAKRHQDEVLGLTLYSSALTKPFQIVMSSPFLHPATKRYAIIYSQVPIISTVKLQAYFFRSYGTYI